MAAGARAESASDPPRSLTGCGCGLVIGALAVLVYVLLFGSSDPGEPVAQATALIAVTLSAVLLLTGARRSWRRAGAGPHPNAG